MEQSEVFYARIATVRGNTLCAWGPHDGDRVVCRTDAAPQDGDLVLVEVEHGRERWPALHTYRRAADGQEWLEADLPPRRRGAAGSAHRV
jgi:hypothetical protein